MTSHDDRLFILAFDHRGSFKSKMFGITDETEDDTARLQAAKQVVWQGFKKAHEAGLPHGAGILVDEEMGTSIAREAKELGIPFAMPVEKSGQKIFDFEYGDDFGEHIEDFDPDYAKVLVRWNPDDDTGAKELQAERLVRLGTWLKEHGRQFLFELLVPASPRQLAMAGDDPVVYDMRLRPVLMLQAISELRERGIEPDVWKIEGVDDSGDCRLVAGYTGAEGRDHVKTVVLGRGADDARVETWLRAAAPVPGYSGFAIGRSIWWEAVASWKDGDLDEDPAADAIATTYRRFVEVYLDAV